MAMSSYGHLRDFPSLPILPVPKVRVRTALHEGNPPVRMFDNNLSPTQSVPLQSFLEVVCVDVPTDLLSPPLGLQLELMVKGPKRGKRADTNGVSSHSAWKHPANQLSTGNDTRGGAQYDVGGLQIDPTTCPTEWSVTQRNQVIDVSQGAAGQCVLWSSPVVPYIGVAGNTQFNAQEFIGSRAKRQTAVGPTMTRGVAQAYAPARVAFRYSVIDQSDPRGGRVSGPVSASIVCGTQVAPLKLVGGAFGQYKRWAWNLAEPAKLHFFFERRAAT